MKLGRNAPCPCKSGEKYKNCHFEIFSKTGLRRLKAYQEKYIREWDVTSADFDSQGAYKWMADQLANHCSPKLVLDIGCGSGLGIDALVERFGDPLSILGIEQNEQCIQKTALLKLGWKTVLRAEPELVSDCDYIMKFKPGLLPKTIDGVTIIESDILFDPEIDEYLQQLPKFDAVTIWLIGSQQGMQNCVNLNPLNVKTPGELRLRIQNKVYVLADSILRPGGVLQVVDRVEYPSSDDLIEDGLRSHRDQASVTSLTVVTSSHMPYTEPGSGAVGMIVTRGTSGRVGNTDRLALCSTISVKPTLNSATIEEEPDGPPVNASI